MLIKADIVCVDVPFVVGVDVLDRFKLIVNTVDDELESRASDWKLPLERN